MKCRLKLGLQCAPWRGFSPLIILGILVIYAIFAIRYCTNLSIMKFLRGNERSNDILWLQRLSNLHLKSRASSKVITYVTDKTSLSAFGQVEKLAEMTKENSILKSWEVRIFHLGFIPTNIEKSWSVRHQNVKLYSIFPILQELQRRGLYVASTRAWRFLPLLEHGIDSLLVCDFDIDLEDYDEEIDFWIQSNVTIYRDKDVDSCNRMHLLNASMWGIRTEHSAEVNLEVAMNLFFPDS